MNKTQKFIWYLFGSLAGVLSSVLAYANPNSNLVLIHGLVIIMMTFVGLYYLERLWRTID